MRLGLLKKYYLCGVFHSIRFKVNKRGSAESFFLCPDVKALPARVGDDHC